MQPRWLLEPEVFSEDSQSLIAALDKMGVPYECLKFGVPYESYYSKWPYNLVVFHGSLQFARRLIQNTNWTGIYCNLREFECTWYYPIFGDLLLNSNYVMLPFGDVKRRKDWLFEFFGDKFFIRPSNGRKTFTGEVISKDDVWDFDRHFLTEDHEIVVVAPYIPIKREWRLVVIKDGLNLSPKKIISAAQYRDGEDFTRSDDVPQEIWDFGNKVLEETGRYDPDPAWTLDICETEQGDLKVLEVGSFSCAGIYARNAEPIVEAINEVTIREHIDVFGDN